MYNSYEIAERIKILTRQKNFTIKELLEQCELGKNTISKMSSGTDILTKNMVKIANFLDCSLDFLVGRSDETCNTSNITGSKNVVQQGNVNNSPVTISDILSAPLSEQETELLNIFKSLPPKEKHKVMTFMYDIEDKNKL